MFIFNTLDKSNAGITSETIFVPNNSLTTRE